MSATKKILIKFFKIAGITVLVVGALIYALIIILAYNLFSDNSDNLNVPAYSITGNIVDVEQNPIPNVSISIHGLEDSTTTNSKGQFKFYNAKDLTMTFEKRGYQPSVLKIPAFSLSNKYDLGPVVLVKAKDSVPSKNRILPRKEIPNYHDVMISGIIRDAFEDFLPNVIVVIKSQKAYSRSNDAGVFYQENPTIKLQFLKSGFLDLTTSLSPNSKNVIKNFVGKIILPKAPPREGVYLLQQGVYRQLPFFTLKHKTIDDRRKSLSGMLLGDNETKYFTPETDRSFEIDPNQRPMRFLVYTDDPVGMFIDRNNPDKYICTYYRRKLSTIGFSQGSKAGITTFPYYGSNFKGNYCIYELNTKPTNKRYIFVNAINRRGYFFTY